jgi:poly(beta-D-mannuronate) lyase
MKIYVTSDRISFNSSCVAHLYSITLLNICATLFKHSAFNKVNVQAIAMKKILTAFFLFVAAITNATDHLVSSAEEANKLLNSAKPNDKVILKDGIYKNAVIKFTNTNITFTAEHGGKVFFEDNSTLSFAGKENIVEGFVWQNGGKDLDTKNVIEFKNGKELANHCKLKNCSIIGYNTVDLNTDNKWVSLFGTYNTVEHCLLKDKFNRGATLTVWLDGTTEAHHTISYNYFLNRQNGPEVDNGLESIRIGDSKSSFTPAHCVVAFNRFEQCDGEIEIISNKSCHNSYLHNSFVNNNGGLTLRHGNDCLADGNFFDGADKPKAYGVRFIGEGHVAINNYFYHLNGGSGKDPFRTPVSFLNGLVNTPINGYFQVRRAVLVNNIFVNCNMPAIRVGAFSKREGMTVAPDTILIKVNLIFDDAGKVGNVYEELTAPSNLTIKNNGLIGEYLKANQNGFVLMGNKGKRDGFNWIKDGKGNMLTSVEAKAALTYNTGVGANWVEPSIANEVKKRKYTITAVSEVGPVWMK